MVLVLLLGGHSDRQDQGTPGNGRAELLVRIALADGSYAFNSHQRFSGIGEERGHTTTES